jgi:ribosomal protein L37AE/L43A
VSSSRLTGYSPYRNRPKRLLKGSAEGHFVNAKYARSGKRRLDDPTPVVPSSHVKLLRCPHCRRVRHIHIREADHFWTCCEGVQMIDTRQTLRSAQQTHIKLQKLARQYDFAEMKPRSNLHKPASRARSKMPK